MKSLRSTGREMENAGAGDQKLASASPGSILRRMKLEALVFVLLIVTFGAVQFQELFTSRELRLTPGSAALYPTYWYGDENNGGNSTADAKATTPLRWGCQLNPGYQYPYCGYGILFDTLGTGRGIDFSRYQTMKIAITYRGEGESFRLIVKDHDPRYGGKKGEILSKPNEFEASLPRGRGEISVSLADFVPAAWWLTQNDIPEDISSASFANVVAMEFQPGTGTPLGRHEFSIESITLEGSSFSQAQWYLLLLGFWVLLIGSFLVFRVVYLRKAFEGRHRQQVRESRELSLAKAAAESASRAKSEFLANMSHELRTPLNAILGYAQLLERAKLDEQHALAARTIHRSGSHLLTLITDILDLSRIEAGKLELTFAPLDIHCCVEEVAEMMRLKAEEKSLRLVCDLAPDLPRFVIGDEKRIRQLLINLAGNAVKFTTDGEVSVRVSAPAQTSDSTRLRFEVADTGPGIPPDMLDHIFEPFEQVGAAQTRAGGTGLGLSISRQIAALMGGEIKVESASGQGSRFWFELDLPLFLEASIASALVAPTDAAGRRPRILVVDDLADNRAVIVQTLEPHGFELHEAADGASAIEAAQADRPDLILMDVRMPVIDGLDATARLRAIASLRDVPVIAISACATTQVERDCLEAGAAAFLAKPIDEKKLLDLIIRHLGPQWSGPGADVATRDSGSNDRATIVAPPQEQMEVLHKLAMTGNMRALRTKAKEIGGIDPVYLGFAERLEQLARTYQSPAILSLIERHLEAKRAA